MSNTTTFNQLVAGSTSMTTTNNGDVTTIAFSRGSAPLGVADLDNRSGAVLSAITNER